MTVVAMSSLFSFQTPSTACKTSVGVQAFLVGSLVGRMALYCLQSIRGCSGILVGSLVGRKAGALLIGGVSGRLALITDKPHVGVNVRSLMV